MSYSKAAGMLAYFIPNIPLATTTAGVLREVDIGAASGDHGEYVCIKPCTVLRCGFIVTGEVVGGTSAAPTVIFKKRPTPLSATSEATVATLTIPDTTAVGKAVYADDSDALANVDFAVGDSMEISWTIGSGSPTGMGHAFWECYDKDEEPANNTDMVESA